RLGRLRPGRLGTRLGQPCAQLVGGCGRDRCAPAPAEEGADPEPSREQREEALHAADATLPPASRHARRAVPPEAASTGRGRLSPWEEGGRFGRMMTEYEIMVLLDPELPEERGNQVIQRVRDAVDASGGTWDGHEPWGRRRLAYEIDHKAEAVYHLLLLTTTPEAL